MPHHWGFFKALYFVHIVLYIVCLAAIRARAVFVQRLVSQCWCSHGDVGTNMKVFVCKRFFLMFVVGIVFSMFVKPHTFGFYIVVHWILGVLMEA